MNVSYIIKVVLGILGICLLVGSVGFDSTTMAMAAIACALITNFIHGGESKARTLPIPPEPTPIVEESKPEPKSVFKCETCKDKDIDKEFDTEAKLKKHIGMAHWKDIKV